MIDEILTANNLIKTPPNAVRTTPLEKSLALSHKTSVNIYLKYESMQLTGSFKLRGATNKLAQLSETERQNGVITASTGNHGLGVVMACQLLRVGATIYVPEAASKTKTEAIKQLGGELVFVKGDGYLAETTAKQQAEKTGKVYISPYNDRQVICGQASVGVELMQQLPELDAIFTAVGGGGLIGGLGSFVKHINPNIEIVGCWPEVARSFYEALKAGKVFEVAEAQTLSDGTAGGVETDTITLGICQKIIDTKILVTEAEIAAAMRLIATSERQIIEGAAGVAVAGALKRISEKPQQYAGKNIAIIICGRNIEFEKFKQIILR